MKIILYSDTNEAHYHKKGFALSLVLEVRVFGTWRSETIDLVTVFDAILTSRQEREKLQ